MNRKYHFTPELREELRLAYCGGKRSIGTALDRLQRKTGWPRHAFKCEATRMGWTTENRRPWNAIEDGYLAGKIGIVSLKQIARALHRSVESVTARAERLRLSRRARDGYCIADLASAMGVHPGKVERWVSRGLLGKERDFQGRRVAEQNVVRFLRRHAAEYDLRRVDQVWFRTMVFGSAYEQAQ